MAHLAAWVLLCVLLAWIMRDRPILTICAAVVLWSVIPAIAASLLTGQSSGPLALHPATWLVLVTAGIQLLIAGPTMVGALSRHIYLTLAVGTFITGAFLTSRVTGSGGLKLLGDQIMAPALVFWVIVAFATGRPVLLRQLRSTLIAVVAVQAALSLTQSIVDEVLLYEKYYLTFPWFKPETFERGMGTTDSPLVLSLAICVTAPLLIGLSNNWLRFGLLTLFFAGVAASQSRTGLLVMGLVVVAVVMRSRMTLIARSLCLIGLAGIGFWLLQSTLIEGVTGRFSNDSGSSAARGVALDAFFQRFNDYILTGSGPTSSYRLTNALGLQSSLESSYLMYIVDTGFVLATLYFGAQLFLLVRYGPGPHLIRGATAGAAIGCLLQHTFSSLAGSNLDGTLVWCLLAIVVAGAAVPASSSPDADAVAQAPTRTRRQPVG